MELTVVPAAGEYPGALGDGVVEVEPGPLEHLGRAQRPEVGLGVERVADPQPRCPRQQRLEELILDRLVHQHALGSGAALAREVEAPAHRRVGGPLDVRVGEHDLRAVPSQLEHPVSQAGLPGDPLAGGDRAGEDDRVDARVGDQRGAGLSATVDEVDDAIREARLSKTSTKSCAHRGACSDGFHTAVQPSASP